MTLSVTDMEPMTQVQTETVSPLYGPSGTVKSESSGVVTLVRTTAPSSAVVNSEQALYLLAASTGSEVDQAISKMSASTRSIILFITHLPNVRFGALRLPPFMPGLPQPLETAHVAIGRLRIPGHSGQVPRQSQRAGVFDERGSKIFDDPQPPHRPLRPSGPKLQSFLHRASARRPENPVLTRYPPAAEQYIITLNRACAPSALSQVST